MEVIMNIKEELATKAAKPKLTENMSIAFYALFKPDSDGYGFEVMSKSDLYQIY
jgi:hypothetical protein